MLMEGVNILNQQTIRSDDAVGIFVILGLVALIFSVGLLVSKDIGFKLAGVLVVMIGILCFLSAFIQPEPYQEYKVTIDKSVKLEEFNNKYKIINQEGKIYTIQKK